MSRDSFGGVYTDPFTLNRWAYAHDNPVMLTDGSGHCDILCVIAILITLGLLTQGCSSSLGQDVVLPRVVSLDVYTENATILTNGVAPSKVDQLLGFQGSDNANEGIRIEAKVDFNGVSKGRLEWVQNGKSFVQFVDQGGTPHTSNYNDRWYLDADARYPNGDEATLTSNGLPGVTTVAAWDSPVVELNGSKSMSLFQEYRMYLVWRPANAEDKQRIPIARVDWGWNVSAFNHGKQYWDSEIGTYRYYRDWEITTKNISVPVKITDMEILMSELPSLGPLLSTKFD